MNVRYFFALYLCTLFFNFKSAHAKKKSIDDFMNQTTLQVYGNTFGPHGVASTDGLNLLKTILTTRPASDTCSYFEQAALFDCCENFDESSKCKAHTINEFENYEAIVNYFKFLPKDESVGRNFLESLVDTWYKADVEIFGSKPKDDRFQDPEDIYVSLECARKKAFENIWKNLMKVSLKEDLPMKQLNDCRLLVLWGYNPDFLELVNARTPSQQGKRYSKESLKKALRCLASILGINKGDQIYDDFCSACLSAIASSLNNVCGMVSKRDVVKSLVELKVDPNVQTKDTETLLDYAAMRHDGRLLTSLLEASADPNGFYNPDLEYGGGNLLTRHCNMSYDEEKESKEEVSDESDGSYMSSDSEEEKDATSNKKENHDFMISEETVRHALSAATIVDDKKGTTSHKHITQMLLDAKADPLYPNVTTQLIRVALYFEAWDRKEGYHDFEEILFPGPTAFLKLMQSKDVNFNQALNKNDCTWLAQQNVPDKTTILHLIASKKLNKIDHECLDVLFTLGADPTLRDANNKTALELAEENGYKEFIDRYEKFKD